MSDLERSFTEDLKKSFYERLMDEKKNVEENERILMELEQQENKLMESLKNTLNHETELRSQYEKEKKLNSPVQFQSTLTNGFTSPRSVQPTSSIKSPENNTKLA